MKLFCRIKIHFNLLNLTLNFCRTERKESIAIILHYTSFSSLRFPCTSVTLKGLFKIFDESIKKKQEQKQYTCIQGLQYMYE